MNHLFFLASTTIPHLPENAPSWLTIALAVLSAAATLFMIFREYREGKIEQSTLNLSMLAESRDLMQGQITELKAELAEINKQRTAIEEKLRNTEQQSEKLQRLNDERDALILGLQNALAAQAADLKKLQDQFYEARLMISILDTQKKEMARRFAIPTSVAEKERDHGNG